MIDWISYVHRFYNRLKLISLIIQLWEQFIWQLQGHIIINQFHWSTEAISMNTFQYPNFSFILARFQHLYFPSSLWDDCLEKVLINLQSLATHSLGHDLDLSCEVIHQFYNPSLLFMKHAIGQISILDLDYDLGFYPWGIFEIDLWKLGLLIAILILVIFIIGLLIWLFSSFSLLFLILLNLFLHLPSLELLGQHLQLWHRLPLLQ